MKRHITKQNHLGLRFDKTKKWHSIHTKNLKKRRYLSSKRKGHLIPNPLRIQGIKNIMFPKDFNLLTNYERSMSAVRLVRNNVQKGHPVLVNLQLCEEVSLEACVVLAAEVERCRSHNKELIWGTYPKNKAAIFLLEAMGFFEHIQVQTRQTFLELQPHIEIVRLTSAEARQSGEKEVKNATIGMKNLFDSIKQDEVIVESRISAALQEAMDNVINYAYPASRRSSMMCLPKWWRAGINDKKNHTVMAVFYDQGVGIPSTLRTERKWTPLLSYATSILKRSPSDHEIIKIAIDEYRSSTKQSHHGKGLNFMREVIDNLGSGCMLILSQRGKYEYTMPNNTVTASPLPVPIDGTLILWQADCNRNTHE